MEQLETHHPRQDLGKVLPLSAPFIIYLDPCGMCNFKCGFCPCNNSNERKAERHAVMPWELFEKITQDLKAFRGEVKVINLYCFGEPLLNPRIVDMVRAIKENQLCREVRITTNGSLLVPQLSQALINAGIDLVRVSVEALNDEDYKTICRSPVSFETIRSNIADFYRLSRGSKSKISAKIVNAALKSQEDVHSFYRLFEGITDFHFVEEVEEYWPDFDMTNFRFNGVNAIQKCYLPGEHRKICTFPFTDMVITSRGKVLTCCVDWKCGNNYGDAAVQHLYELWHGTALKDMQLKHLDKSAYENTICKFCMRKSVDSIDDAAVKIKQRIDACAK